MTNTPTISQKTVDNILKLKDIQATVNLIGVRGFYSDNKINVYDDAIFLVSANCLLGFSANCDPSKYFQNVAILQNGLYKYKLGIHGLNKEKSKQYEALVQASSVLVRRFGAGLDNGFFGINIHKGGVNTTSSLGCQTIHPSQWDFFMSAVKAKMVEHGLKEINYILTDGV